MGGPGVRVSVKRLSSKREIGIFIAEQSASAPHLAHPEGCTALRSVLVTVPRVSRSCEHFPDGFDLHLLQPLLPKHDPDLLGKGFRFKQKDAMKCTTRMLQYY